MASCELLKGCAFFNAEEIAGLHNLTDYLKKTFCFDDFSRCGRYQVATTIGRQQVPVLMTPDQHQWAQQILKDHKHNHQTDDKAD